MNDVTFGYDLESAPTIKDLSLEVLPGEFVAVTPWGRRGPANPRSSACCSD